VNDAPRDFVPSPLCRGRAVGIYRRTAAKTIFVARRQRIDAVLPGGIDACIAPRRLPDRFGQVQSGNRSIAEIYFRTRPGGNDPTALWRKLTAKGTYPHGVTIRQRVSPSTFALLKRIARIPQGVYETQKPWAIAALNLKAQGMETVKSEWSMDHYINERTRYRGETSGLETIDEFVRSFSEMSDRESESFLLQAIEYGQRSPELLNETIAAWKAGNASRIYQLYAPRRNGSGGYWRWIEKRSALWIPRIEAAVRSGQPTMVIVGALHLCGPRGLIAELQKHGYKLEQL
jgi:uncharacterized protein YbaP (TraB family)